MTQNASQAMPAPRPPLSVPRPSSHYVSVLDREIHYTEWGAPDAPVLLAAHGLARTGRDMDDIAAHLSNRWRVICPDTIGRGLSQWSPLPDEEYCLDFYARHLTALVDALGIDQVTWLGTSMGGAIGMVAAAGPLAGRVSRLVLNDNAPALEAAAIARIRAYAGQPPSFATVTDLEAFLRVAYQPYGWISDEGWRRMTESSARRLPDGRITTHYDPAITRQFHRALDDYALWPVYESLRLPVLVLRGAESDLVARATTDRMQTVGPRARVVEIAGCGHAPALNVPAQWQLVRDFIEAG